MRWSSTEPAAPVAALALAMLAMTASPASAQLCHSGRVEEDAIVWRTTTWESARFLAPLPDDVRVESIEGGTVVREDGRVVGVDRLAGSRRVVLVTRQHLDGEDVTLHPPLVPDLQRVVLAAHGGESVSFAPALDGAIERHVGYHASRDMSWRTRRSVDDACGGRDAHAIPIYVTPSSPDELRGTLVRASERRTWLMVLGGVLLGSAVLGGALVHRRFARQAEIERADAAIEARFRELGPVSGKWRDRSG